MTLLLLFPFYFVLLLWFSDAFGLNVQDVEQQQQLAIKGSVSFDEIFAAGVKALNLETGSGNEIKSVVDDDPVVKKRECSTVEG